MSSSIAELHEFYNQIFYYKLSICPEEDIVPPFQIIPAGPELLPLPHSEKVVIPFETYAPPEPVVPAYIPPPELPPAPVAVYGPPPPVTTTPPSAPYPAPVEVSSGSTFESDNGVVAVVEEVTSPAPEPIITEEVVHVKPSKHHIFHWKKPKVIKIWKPKLVFTKKIIHLPHILGKLGLLKKHH